MEKNTARLEAFSDGIIAVAITMLALEIGVKEYHGVTNANLWSAIAARGYMYMAYINSFATILLVWMAHHRIVAQIKSTNQWVQLMNGVLLMLLALFPFPTRLVGEFLGTPGESTAVCFYVVYMGVIIASFIAFNATVLAHEGLMIDPTAARRWLLRLRTQQWLGLLVYAVAAALAWVWPMGALILTMLVWVWWFVSTAE